MGVGLAVVPGVEQPHPRGQLGRDVHDDLAGLEQPLRQRTARTVGALDRPHRAGHALTYVSIAAYPARSVANRPVAELAFVVVDDLDRGRQLVGIDPDDDLLHAAAPACTRTYVDGEVGSATTSRAVPS